MGSVSLAASRSAGSTTICAPQSTASVAGAEQQVNMRFLAMGNHYVFEPVFCNPAAGWEKGQVEKNVQDSRHRLWQPMPDFPDLAALNDWLEQQCVALWGDIPHAALPGNVADVWAGERTALLPLPPAFDGFVEHSKRVSPTCLISFERNRYSVPASFANPPVSLRVYPERLVIAAEGQILCEHVPVIERSHRLPLRTIGSSNPCGSDDRRLGKGHERPPHSSAVCPSRGRVAHPIASSTNAWRLGHFCGFASGSPVRLRLRRPLAKANVFALELKSRPRLGAICRQEPCDRDGSWPLSAFRTAGTTPRCFHTRRLRPVRPTDPQHRAGSGQTDGTQTA